MRRLGLAIFCVTCLACDSSTPTTPTPACTYTLSNSSFSFEASGGSGSITVTAESRCSWSASSQSGWLSITSGATGNGSGVVAFSASSNAASEPRAGTLGVGGLTVSVNQKGAGAAPCEYTVSPDRTSFSKDAGMGTVTVSAAAQCAWSAASDVPWLTVTTGAQGAGNGTVSYAVARNTDIPDRHGGLVVATQAIAITQAGDTGGCQYSLAPLEFNVCMTVPEFTTTVTTQPGCPWTASSSLPWLTVTGGQSGNGSGTIRMRASDNWEGPRDGVVAVRWPTPTAGQNLRVFQAGCLYAVSTAQFTFATAGGSGAFDVIQTSVPNSCGGPTQNACLWTAQADVPWITIVTSMPRVGDDRVSFTVAANASGASRSGRIAVRDKTVVISQP